MDFGNQDFHPAPVKTVSDATSHFPPTADQNLKIAKLERHK
jgi:hypothetical protein